MSDGESIDGVPLQDNSSDSSDIDHDIDSSTKSECSAKIGSQSDIIKVLEDKKPESKASGFSMTLSRMTPSGSASAQSSALSSKKGVQPKSASEIGAIKMKIGVQKCKEPPVIGIKRSSELVSKVFNPDESDDEEMPPEAKMRMRNLGKDTPTAEGPNSFSKGKLGFCDRTKAIQRQLDQFVADPPVKKL